MMIESAARLIGAQARHRNGGGALRRRNMAQLIARSRIFSLFFFAMCACVASAQDARIALFDRYNHASTYDDIKPLVSGVLAQQYAFVGLHDAQQLQQILTQQRLTSYRPRIVEIDDATSFLVLDNVTSTSSREPSGQAYVLAKSPTSDWTLANRLMADSVLKTLWTTRFTPTEFVQPSSCSIDGRDIKPQSALAIRQGNSIEITLYPFTFSQADLDYWRQVSGMPVNEDALAGSHFNDRQAVVCRLIVKLDKANQPSLLNVGFDEQTGAGTRSKLWQPSKADVSTLTLEKGALALVTAGTFGADKDGIHWNLKIKVPVWEKGL